MYYARPTYNKRNTLYLFSNEGMRFILFDFETTGLDLEKDRPVQIALLVCEIRNGLAEVVDKYSTFIRQSVPMGKKASEKNHITDDMLTDAPTEESVFHNIYKYIGDSPILCGYNITEFDVPILSVMYKRYGKDLRPIAVLDVSEMARDVVLPAKGQKRTQEAVADMYGISHGITFHDACGDVEACLRILNVIKQEYDEEKCLAVSGNEPIYVNGVYFSKGHNMLQQGIYIVTQFDRKKVHLWYSTAYKCWCSAQLELSRYDIDQLTRDALQRTARKLGMSNLALPEFGRLTEKKFRKE